MTSSLRLANGDPLPNFLSYNNITNVINGFASSHHINTWVISYVATDEQGYQSEINFKLIINGKQNEFEKFHIIDAVLHSIKNYILLISSNILNKLF